MLQWIRDHFEESIAGYLLIAGLNLWALFGVWGWWALPAALVWPLFVVAPYVLLIVVFGLPGWLFEKFEDWDTERHTRKMERFYRDHPDGLGG